MKVVLIGPVYPFRGGIAHHTALLARSFAQAGHAVRVVSFKRQYPSWLYPGATDRDPSASPLATPAEFLLDPLYPWTWRTAWRRIASFAPDLVIFQWWTTFWSFAFASLGASCRKSQIPVAAIIHNVLPHEVRPWDAWLASRFLSRPGALIAQNPNEAQRLLELLPRAHVLTCEMPLYTAFTAEEISQEQARQQLGIPLQRPVLLFFGIVRPYKGLSVLLDALALLKRQGQPPFLLVAGEFWEDVQDCRAAISRLALEDDVRLENRYIPNEEVDILFSAANLLVAPYLAGTQSAAVALALGRGLPAVLTERIAAGVPPAARDLTRVVPAGDAAALAQAIQALLAELPAIQPPPLDAQADWLRLVRLLEPLAAHGSPVETAL